MRIRTILLAGAVFPFAIGAGSALAETPSSPAGWVLAQTEPVLCADGSIPPAGAECPPIEQAPAEAAPSEEPPAEAAPAEEAPAEAAPAEAAPVEEAPAEPAPAEAPAGTDAQPAEAARTQESAPAEAAPDSGQTLEAPATEVPPSEAAPEEPAPAGTTDVPPTAEEPTPAAPEPELPAAVQQEPLQTPEAAPADAAAPAGTAPAVETPSEPPAAGEAPTPQDVLRRARRQQQQLQEQQGGQAGQPADQQPATTAEPQQPIAPAGQDPAAATAPVPEAPSVVEQQLEAQGDEQQAEQIRILREKLRQESEAAAAAAPPAADAGQQPQASEEDDGSGWGWWRRDGERADRRDRRDRGDRGRGRGEVVEERGDRIIIDLGGGNLYVEQVVPDEGERLLYGANDVEVQELPGGRTQTIVYRENGSQIITIRDRRGEIIRRVRVTPNGREVVLIDNRYEDDYEELPPAVLFEVDDLPPLVIDIPEEDYIVDLGRASEADIEGALLAPPVQRVERSYTLEEVTRNERVRAYVPRIDLDTITFDFGSATIGNNQMRALSALGQAMAKVLAERPDEVYLIEGHTDAVGSDYDNLILSDRRAEAVAVALSQNFDIPPENLVTEGYGEQYLKVQTEEPNRENRRATVRRITELLQAENQQ